MLEKISPLVLTDYYKVGHRKQYPEGTELVYSNFTPRQSRIKGVNSVIFFGLQYFIKEYLIDRWNKGFFDLPKDVVVASYKRRMDTSLGKDSIPIDHIEELHDLGYLPILIKALEEGTLCPMGVPCLTISNTIPKFFWLTNYLETLLSNILWKPITSATTAYQYRKRFELHVLKTGYDSSFIKWQGHDFSNRGMSGIEDAVMSGAGHLLSFTGTDTISAIDFLEMYYNANSEKELIGASVCATEHSVMSMGGIEDEFGTFKRLITELYSSGIVSIVSDTFDFWQVMTDFLPRLKSEIMNRKGRVVIRPDSGNPVRIICGYNVYDLTSSHITMDELRVEDVEAWGYDAVALSDGTYSLETRKPLSEAEIKGAYEVMWDIFGGETNAKGFKILDTHIGLIYGDSITRQRQDEILTLLEKKGFAFSNGVLGIGSFTYEYVTRDSFGFAVKATYGIINGVPKEIFKNPKTDSGFKKSARGLLMVTSENGILKLTDRVTPEEEQTGLLRKVFENGNLINETSLKEIREIVENNLNRELGI